METKDPERSTSQEDARKENVRGEREASEAEGRAEEPRNDAREGGGEKL